MGFEQVTSPFVFAAQESGMSDSHGAHNNITFDLEMERQSRVATLGEYYGVPLSAATASAVGVN